MLPAPAVPFKADDKDKCQPCPYTQRKFVTKKVKSNTVDTCPASHLHALSCALLVRATAWASVKTLRFYRRGKVISETGQKMNVLADK